MIALQLSRRTARYVLWPRIDQKSCLKSMLSLGLEVIVIEPILNESKGLTTNLEAIKNQIELRRAENILAIHSTISCFAPRQPDNIDQIALISHEFNIPHIVNGAYFLQSKKSVNLLNSALRKNRRVDCVVCSTDKNFMTPVGGAIILSSTKGEQSMTERIANNYPGRASMSPKLDLFITLLEMGRGGYKKLLEDQKSNFNFLLEELNMLAEKHNTKIISSNQISISVSLKPLLEKMKDLKEIGSMLFTRNVSGPRVVTCSGSKNISSIELERFGCSSSHFNEPYLALACAVGMKKSEIEKLIQKLDSIFSLHV